MGKDEKNFTKKTRIVLTRGVQCALTLATKCNSNSSLPASPPSPSLPPCDSSQKEKRPPTIARDQGDQHKCPSAPWVCIPLHELCSVGNHVHKKRPGPSSMSLSFLSSHHPSRTPLFPEAILKGGVTKEKLPNANRSDRSRGALCFLVKTWARHKTTETILSNGWRLTAVGSWWLVVGGWQLVVLGGGP